MADVTRLSYAADFQVGGKLAQLGSRMLVPATQKIAEEFFGRLAAEIGGRAAADFEATADAQPTEWKPRPKPWGLRIVLVLGFLSALILLVFGLWSRFG
jgi:hypothetical protein